MKISELAPDWNERVLGLMIKEMEAAMAGERVPEKFCVDCQHFDKDGGTHLCFRPIVSPVTGQTSTLAVSAHNERQPSGGCGPHAGFFRKRVVSDGGVKYAEEDDGA